MANKLIESQAKSYLYDLNNCAHEYGFNKEEHWVFSLATENEKTAIVQKFYPTVLIQGTAVQLAELYKAVKDKYSEMNNFLVDDVTGSKSDKTNAVYLIAHNPKRLS